MNPYEIQNSFFTKVIENKDISNKRISIYADLILFRINDAIKSTFPIYVSSISKEELEKQIKKFIIYGSKTSYVWQIALEFFDFLLKIYGISLLHKQILYFENAQIKIYVSNKNIMYKKINHKRKYTLSSNAFIQKHDYNITNRSFTKSKTQYYLVYKSIEDYDVYYINISKFLYLFLKKLRNFNTIDDAIKLASKQSNIKYKDAKSISYNTINNFVSTGIIL